MRSRRELAKAYQPHARWTVITDPVCRTQSGRHLVGGNWRLFPKPLGSLFIRGISAIFHERNYVKLRHFLFFETSFTFDIRVNRLEIVSGMEVEEYIDKYISAKISKNISLKMDSDVIMEQCKS